MICEFLFHTGSIRSSTTITLDASASASFYSTLVRLEAGCAVTVSIYDSGFYSTLVRLEAKESEESISR